MESAVADFRSEELSHGHDWFQHIQYYKKPPELNNFNETSKILRVKPVQLPFSNLDSNPDSNLDSFRFIPVHSVSFWFRDRRKWLDPLER